MAIHAALILALLGSLALAFMLWRWADGVAGVRLLMGFLIGVAVWIAGNELPTWFGPGATRLGLIMLATAAVTSAVFFHFTVAFTGISLRRTIAGAYLVGILATLLSIVLVPGSYQPFASMRYVAMPNEIGWVTSLIWALLAGGGQLVLLQALLRRRGLPKRQVATVIASSAWGLLCMSGYGIAALHLPMPPWPLLGLPLYPVFLVYGILRYELLLASAWARRALAWAILVAVAGGIVAAVPLLPTGTQLGARLFTAAGVGLAFLVLGGPARRLAERIVYPGGNVTAEDLAAWRQELAVAVDTDDLAERAGALLTRRLSIAVRICIGAGPADLTPVPVLRCRREGAAWHSQLESGWESAPPGPKRVAALFGAVLAEAVQTLERAVSLAERERERQLEARLAELGALAATVAHDVRNPLNIISMAMATAAPELKREVTAQITRISRLADDLLDYARPWSITPAPLDLAALLRALALRREAPAIALALPEILPVIVDAGRIEQAVDNLLENACAVAGRVLLAAEQSPGLVAVHVCDDGPGIPPELRARIFQPFVSRSPGGTGLGLSIVARIAAAHGGSIVLGERAGWATCLTLRLPVAA